MVTAASTAQLAVLLVDARHGVVDADAAPRDARAPARHSRISWSPSTRWTSSAIGEDVFVAIVDDVRAFRERTAASRGDALVPMSALRRRHGRRARCASWLVHGPDAARDPGDRAASRRDAARCRFRFPVQFVAPMSGDAPVATWAASSRARSASATRSPCFREGTPRGFATSAAWRSSARSRDGTTTSRCSSDDQIDIARGDMLVRKDEAAVTSKIVEATLSWLDAAPLDLARTYRLRHTTRDVRARVRRIDRAGTSIPTRPTRRPRRSRSTTSAASCSTWPSRSSPTSTRRTGRPDASFSSTRRRTARSRPGCIAKAPPQRTTGDAHMLKRLWRCLCWRRHSAGAGRRHRC